MQDRTSERTAGRVPENIPERERENVPENLPGRVPEGLRRGGPDKSSNKMLNVQTHARCNAQGYAKNRPARPGSLEVSSWTTADWTPCGFVCLEMRMGMGLGWGGMGIMPNVSRATLHDHHLHLMLRYMVFTCTWCYATWSSFALDATLHDLPSRFDRWGWGEDGVGLGWGGVGIIPNVSRATLHDLHLHLMLR